MNFGPRDDEIAADPFGAFVSRAPEPERTNGPLADLRLAVKDNIAVKGEPFTAGLPLCSPIAAPIATPPVSKSCEVPARVSSA